MRKTQLVVFNKENTREVLVDLDFKVQKKKTGKKNKEIVINPKGLPACCSVCEKEIVVKKVGTIAHGSRLLFCDNPLCFATWVAKNKI